MPIRPDTLQAIPLFSSLSQSQLERLALSCSPSPCVKGSIFFVEGQKAEGFYLLLQGRVKIFRTGPDGREAILHLFGPNEPFGEAAVFEGGLYPATAQCLESGTSLFLARRTLLAHMRDDPELGLRMLAALSRRLRSFAGIIERLTLQETPQRLASYLLLQIEEQQGKSSIRLDTSKTLLAGILGTARETLSRTLARFAEQGVIRVDGRIVHILDADFLKRLALGREKLS